MKKVWIVDDDRSIRWVLEKALQKADIPVQTFQCADEVLEALKTETPFVLVSDIRMPGKNGLELLAEIKNNPDWNFPVIIMTAFSDLDSAVSSYQGGAFEYLPKPFDISKAIELIRKAITESTVFEPNNQQPDIATEIVGQAPSMQEVFRAIGKLSQSSVTVLLTGESGSGKEVVARALHHHSPRGRSAFVALNMAAIPRELMESELFGHERGAFTGANSIRHGRFEQAEGGTLFLDEIGDMPLELQTRLLRVLSDGYFYRVGGHQPIKANVRVIAATHQNLEKMVKEGDFREDLFHRLNVIRLRLPSLRERKEDIRLLVPFFLSKSAKQLNVEPKSISKEALEILSAFDFPGNVRQLENVCNWLTVMAPAQLISKEDLPDEIKTAFISVPEKAVISTHEKASSTEELSVTETKVSLQSLDGSLSWTDILKTKVREGLQKEEENLMKLLTEDFEKTVLRTALEETKGRKVEAAVKLGIGRNTMTRKIQDYHLE